jgi:hypothetical protein
VENIWIPDEGLERRGRNYVMERDTNSEIRSYERQASGKNGYFVYCLRKLTELVIEPPGHKFNI